LLVLVNWTALGGAMAQFGAHLDMALSTSQRAVAAADLNGDGKAELIGADQTSVSVFLGQ